MKCKFLEYINGINFVVTESEYMLLQNETGVEYANPIDIGEYDLDTEQWKPKYYSYTETDVPVPVEGVEVIDEVVEQEPLQEMEQIEIIEG